MLFVGRSSIILVGFVFTVNMYMGMNGYVSIVQGEVVGCVFIHNKLCL